MATAPGTERPARLRAFGRAVVAWGAEGPGGESGGHRPDLPWRGTRDPWIVLVSEVMAQQTQVSRVVPVFERFVSRFPTVADCAAAPAGEVVRSWAGLGYNRRAVNLHRAATVIVDRHDGAVPESLGDLLALPGIGAYTARAVMAFAFGADVGVVDTNAGRVLSRAVAGRALGTTEAQRLVDALVPPGEGWLFGQSLLDLGALVCVARDPGCRACPVRRRCRWAVRGRPSPDPARGSAGVSTSQAPYAGSDREGRGRLVSALVHGPVAAVDLAAVAGCPDDRARAHRVAGRLVAEGLARPSGDGGLALP